MIQEGYPAATLIAILFIGLSLSFLRPYLAFLFVVFLLSAADYLAFTLTRTIFGGPYFNAHDACLVIVLLAVFFDSIKNNQKITIPKISIWMFLILFVSYFQSVSVDGWRYEYLRALRWAISMPLYLIVGATMVNEKSKVYPFLISLFIGSIFSAIQHIISVQEIIQEYNITAYNIEAARIVNYRSPGLWLLISGLIWIPANINLKRWVLIIVGTLFAISNLLNQWRSFWISSILTFPVAFFFFKQDKSVLKITLLFLSTIVVGFILYFTMKYIHPSLDPEIIVDKRISSLFYKDQRFQTTSTRRLAIYAEMSEFSQGTYIFGRGLAYFFQNKLIHQSYYRIAWGHLGHITTLAQLGFFGFFLYSIYFPYKVIIVARYLWRTVDDNIKFLALLGGLTMIWSWICFIMNNSFLIISGTEAVIFGALFGISKEIYQKNNA